MTKQPLVYIGIPFYNQELFVEETIESVLNQTYKHIKIVVSDDASSDNTTSILKKYEKKYPDIIELLTNSKNLGITNNCNKLLKHIKGKYTAWLGGDDTMHPTKIEEQVKFMENNPNCSISYHNLEVFDANKNKILKLFNNFSNSHSGDIKTIIKYGTFNGASSCMIRVKDIPTNGFNNKLPFASDWLYWVDILSNGGEIKYINKCLGTYKKHKNNITNTHKKECLLDHLNTCNILILKYPSHYTEIHFRYSELVRSARFLYNKNYLYYLLYSFYLNPLNIKFYIIFFIYLITFGKRKL